MRGPIPDRWTPWLLSVFRIVTAFLFIAHGTQKLFGFPSAEPSPGGVDLTSQMGVAGILETFGGLLVLFGLLTRPVAFVLAGEMAFAYFLAHAPGGFWPVLNQGELAVLYAFSFLYLAAAGPGPLSVDAAIERARAARPDRAQRGATGEYYGAGEPAASRPR
jgi:putative oxidoreductase